MLSSKVMVSITGLSQVSSASRMNLTLEIISDCTSVNTDVLTHSS
jgi:hypothetical protein